MIKSKSEKFIEERNGASVTPGIVKSVSGYRRSLLEEQQSVGKNKYELSSQGNIAYSVGIKKNAQSATPPAGGGWRGSGDTVRQNPDVYSPLWLNSNLNLPRDRATINAWCRAFFALNPVVSNAINLHSTYPISKLTIKCHNKKVEKFFNEMIEEIDLMNVCVQLAQEYWLLGEAFVYAELDERSAKWSRLRIQNPDYIAVRKSVIEDEPIIMLRPDENLKRIVTSNKPSDVEQRKQLSDHIIDSVKRGQNIPLDNFNVSHLSRRISPYEARGTGLPVCVFRQLMLLDKIKECYSVDTEVLTDQGFKKINEIIEINNSEKDLNYFAGSLKDINGNLNTVVLNKKFKVACVDEKTNNIEYCVPEGIVLSNYNGKMLHFTGKKVDCMVTPNHNMFVKEQINGKWGNFKKVRASKILEKKKYWKFNSKSNYVSGKNIETINICNVDIPIKLYLKVLGYIVSEGCIYQNFINGRYDAFIAVSQLTSSDCYHDMRSSFEEFASILNKNCNSEIKTVGAGYSKNTPKEKWIGTIHGKELNNYFKNQIGNNNSTLSKDKHLPRHLLDLSPDLLSILLKSLVAGDGSEVKSNYNNTSIGFSYSTISKQLADDVSELVYKCGFVPNIGIFTSKKSDDRMVTEYRVMWSNTNYGIEPLIYTGNKNNKLNGGGATVKEIDYNDAVWCLEVPTGLFITRRNGKISIQGNCKFAQADGMINPLTLVKIGGAGAEFKPTQADLDAYRTVFEEAQYDKDFKVFTHDGVTVERVGYNSGILDTSADITQLWKEIYIGLMVPQVIMESGDITYANGGIALDVLRQRYMQFRNMLTAWLKRKIFAPIAAINEFYEFKDGVKTLIIPEIDWNHMSLFDASDYINILVSLTGDPKRVSVQSLYRSLGLEWDDEVRKVRKEDIHDAIRKKEQEALMKMPLNELRSLNDEDEIPEIVESAIPGESPYDAAVPGQDPSAAPGADVMGGGLLGAPPGGDMGGPPPPPPGMPPSP